MATTTTNIHIGAASHEHRPVFPQHVHAINKDIYFLIESTTANMNVPTTNSNTT